jgi:hypothetical protein
MSGDRHEEELGSLRLCALDLGQARPSYGHAVVPQRDRSAISVSEPRNCVKPDLSSNAAKKGYR